MCGHPPRQTGLADFPHPQTLHQLVMRYRVEITRQVSVIYVVLPVLEVSLYRFDPAVCFPSVHRTLLSREATGFRLSEAMTPRDLVYRGLNEGSLSLWLACLQS